MISSTDPKTFARAENNSARLAVELQRLELKSQSTDRALLFLLKSERFQDNRHLALIADLFYAG